MNSQITTALVSGLVALVVAGSTTMFGWIQLRRDIRHRIVDVRSSWATELYKIRLVSYPLALEAMAPLSKMLGAPTTQTLQEVSMHLNVWLYSSGGLCADTTTRSAVTALRDVCAEWALQNSEEPPAGFYEFRNLAIAFLRRDLDADGMYSEAKYGPTPMIAKLERALVSGAPRQSSKLAGMSYRDITRRLTAATDPAERGEILAALIRYGRD